MMPVTTSPSFYIVIEALVYLTRQRTVVKWDINIIKKDRILLAMMWLFILQNSPYLIERPLEPIRFSEGISYKTEQMKSTSTWNRKSVKGMGTNENKPSKK